jgi:hypothetical protein
MCLDSNALTPGNVLKTLTVKVVRYTRFAKFKFVDAFENIIFIFSCLVPVPE